MISEVPAAIYRETKVSAYDGNPLIEALPPILTQLDLCSLVEWLPATPSQEQRSKPLELRFHELPSIRKLVYLLPEYALHSSIMSVLIRDGYTTRNPVKVQTWQNLYYVNAASGGNISPPEPTAHRASGIVFSGLSGMGKSTFINRYLQLYPQVIQHTSYKGKEFIHPQLVWIKIDCPSNGSLSGLVLRFFEAVDSALGTRYADDYFPKKGRAPTLQVLLKEMARIAANYFLGVLIIDELQNLNRAKTQGDEGFLSFLSGMVEHIGVPIIGVGTPSVTKVFKRKLQDARRAAAMGFYDFQRFAESEEAWNDFIETLLGYNWLEQSIEITDDIKAAFYFHSQGITAIVIALFMLAQYRCLADDCEFSSSLLDDISKNELAPVQNAIRLLRSGSPEAMNELDDLKFDKTWETAINDIEAALRDASNKKRASSSAINKRSESAAQKSAIAAHKKGRSTPTRDDKDLRGVTAEDNPHEELRRRGITPVNIFTMGKDEPGK